MKGDKVTATIEKKPEFYGGKEYSPIPMMEESAKNTLKYAHGIDNPTRAETETHIIYSGIATK